MTTTTIRARPPRPIPSVSPEPSATAEPDDDDCTPEVGDRVRRARIDFDDDDAVWTKLKLVG